jgi:hypothetical protein
MSQEQYCRFFPIPRPRRVATILSDGGAMPSWKNALAVAAILGPVALAVYFVVSRPSARHPPAEAENRIPLLKKLVDEQDQQSAQAIATYQPKTQARIDDLDISVVDLLRQLPGVLQVEAGVQTGKPTHRIVHLRDWHFVPKNLYAIDMKNAAGRELSDEEIDRLHQELLLEVQAVQLEQMALLRCLIQHHGLKRICAEGLTTNDLPSYKERVAVLRDMEKDQIPELRKQLRDVRNLIKGMQQTGRTNTQRYEQAKRIETEVDQMLDQHTVRLLELGAAGRLLIASEIAQVLPLDDGDLLEQAKPITPSGKVRMDPLKLTARRDAQVTAVLDHGAFGLPVNSFSSRLSINPPDFGFGRCR